MPKGEFILRLSSPKATQSIHHALCHDLFLRMFTDHVNELLYTASMAELYCNIMKNDVGLTIRVSGFSDKLLLFFMEIFDILMQPGIYLNPQKNHEKSQIFHREVELLCRHLQNDHFKVDQTGRRSRLLALKPSMYSSLDKLEILQNELNMINGKVDSVAMNSSDQNGVSDDGDVNVKQRVTISNVYEYCLSFFDHVIIDALAQGNLSERAIIELGEKLLAHTTSTTTTTATTAATVAVAATVLVKAEASIENSSNLMKISLVNNSITDSSITNILNLSDSAKPLQPIIRLPNHPVITILDVHCNNIKETNIAVEIYYQLSEYNVLDLTKLDFLEQLISESFFDTLRTKQQVSESSRMTSCAMKCHVYYYVYYDYYLCLFYIYCIFKTYSCSFIDYINIILSYY